MLVVAYDVLFAGDCTVALGGDTNGVVFDATAQTISIPCDGARALRLSAESKAGDALSEALDAPELEWRSSGSNVWMPQTAVTSDGEDAAESGDATGGEGFESSLETTVVGPGTLSWQWRLLTPSLGGSGIDLDVDSDGTPEKTIDEACDWTAESVSIAAGEHAVRFFFWNDYGTSGDRCWVDRVSWTGAVPGGAKTATSPEPVPHDWLVAHGLASEGASDMVFETAANAKAKNGRPVWECYVAGLDPTKNEDLLAWIEMDGGVPRVSWTPSDVAGRTYAVWGKATLTNEWSSPPSPAHHFFQVRVALGGASGVDESAWPGSTTVTFDPVGGTVDPAMRTYDAPGALGELPTPARANHDFLGWWTREEGGVKVTERTTVPWSNWTLHARWHYLEPIAQALNPALVFTKGGDADWFAQSADTHDGFAAARSGSIGHGRSTWIETTVEGPGTVTFWWKVSSESSYDYLRFYVDGLSKSSASGTGSGWTQKTFAVAGSGSHSLRWTYSKDGSGSSGSDCGWLDEVVWTPARYTITFDSAGGSAVPAITADYGTALVAPAAPTKEGYVFAGWSPSFPATMPLDGATLTAQWAPNAYTVAFDANGGSGTMSDESFVYGTAMALTANAFARTGYTFAGWARSANGTKVYNDKQSVSNLTSVDGGTVTLYAVWTANSYMVAFDDNGGSGTMSDESFVYGATKALTANAFTRSGYTFAGWAKSANGTKVYNDKQAVSNLTTVNGGTANLYAVWTVNSYTITFDSAGGSAVASITADYGADLTEPSPPTKTGYTFAGWSPTFPVTMPLGGAALTAQWTPNAYSVKFNANGGSGSMPNESFTYGTAKALAANAFTRTGYTFAGWAKSSNGAKVYNDKQLDGTFLHDHVRQRGRHVSRADYRRLWRRSDPAGRTDKVGLHIRGLVAGIPRYNAPRWRGAHGAVDRHPRRSARLGARLFDGGRCGLVRRKRRYARWSACGSKRANRRRTNLLA